MDTKEQDPSKLIALEIFQLLAPKADTDVNVILSAVSMVLSTISAEVGMEEEKAVYAFTKSFRHAKSRIKNIVNKVH